MKRIQTILAGLVLAFSLSACGSTENSSAETAASEETAAETAVPEAQTEQENTETPAEEKDKVLVIYFSATGTTKDIAEKIAVIEDADLYEIRAAQEYTADDLNWHDNNSRTTHEQNDPSVRPELAEDPVSVEGYSVIYIGYPIWWGEEPRIMDTYVESCDFKNITMIPFCTSSSSGMGRSGKNLAENAGTGNWMEGKRFGAGTSSDEIASWISGLK